MFGQIREPGGGFTLLAAGAACLALAAVWLLLPLPAPFGLVLALGEAAAGAVCVALWAARRRRDRYDLNRLWDAPTPEPEEPLQDTVPEEAAPYCGWCDEAYAPGTYRCRRCGRDL